jgi:hypothetical protein
MTMTMPLPQRSLDRPALVNTVLGTVLGVSRRGLLRKGQSFGDLTERDWSRLLAQLDRTLMPLVDPRTGRVSFDEDPTRPETEADHPVVAARLAKLRWITTTLRPAFVTIRGADCFQEACAEDVATLADVVVVRLDSLEQALVDDAAQDILVQEIGEIVEIIHRLINFLPVDIAAMEEAIVGLNAARLNLIAMQAEISGTDLSAPVADVLLTVERCSRCIEEALSEVRDKMEELGLAECDLHVPVGDNTLGDILDAIERAWDRIGVLAGLEGAAAIRQMRWTAQAERERVQAVGALQRENLAEDFALSEDEASALLLTLRRLERRVTRCADELAEAQITGTFRTNYDGPRGGGDGGRGGRGRGRGRAAAASASAAPATAVRSEPAPDAEASGANRNRSDQRAKKARRHHKKAAKAGDNPEEEQLPAYGVDDDQPS